ncbi:sugar transferase [Mucilaginibacter corticis]|uniref:Sugar transferase n=1 Tax=Mucilaginibacter corticis TaxID=2597670 RepID=A0A556M965_9SPHI|nr:sugar transferase [Mucilaginibacter corticis]TSJ36401.1 sugar transferase [Mucilaginibacter corticis]
MSKNFYQAIKQGWAYFSDADNATEIQQEFTHQKVGTNVQVALKVIPGGLLATEIQLAENDPEKVYPENSVAAKRIFDVCFSILVMILGFPVFFLILLITWLSSRGPVFYRQERLGINQRKFYMYKFRSMHCNAECCGPQLSRADDPRITKWGRVIRRTRLDELPQFWNVLKGDMSVVGPRPEREFFAKKILEIRPDYQHLQQLKPGITSIGQVNFGYAENIEQMCERLDHDLAYIKRFNIRYDITVILKTVGVMVGGRGK